MYSASVKEFVRFVAEESGKPDISDAEIDDIMMSYGFRYDAHFKEVE